MKNGYSTKSKLIEQHARGSGTSLDPEVLLYMPLGSIEGSQIATIRQNACIDVAWSAARALDFSGVRIRSWNHNTQFTYDERGRRIMETDKNGVDRYKVEEADCHMTVQFYHVGQSTCYPAHVYTVDDNQKVPQRLMLISERKHTRVNDFQSPQVWLDPRLPRAMAKAELADNIDREQLLESLKEIVYFDIDNKTDRTESQAYQCWFDDLSDADMLRWGFAPEIIAALRDEHGGTGYIVNLSKEA